MLTVQDKNYTLQANDCAILLPNEVHSYHTSEHSESYLCIFSKDYVPDFIETVQNCSAENPVFHIESLSKTITRLKHPENNFALKSELYDILSAFYRSAKLIPKEKSKNDFVQEVLIFIENHYREDITLHDLADQCGYTYHYASALFNRFFSTNFPTILNECRVGYACQLLKNTDKSISEIASLCGYNSLRAFNRNFAAIKNKTPTDFRKYN